MGSKKRRVGHSLREWLGPQSLGEKPDAHRTKPLAERVAHPPSHSRSEWPTLLDNG